MGSATMGMGVALGGVAVVCCPHDREKRQIVTEQQVVELGLAVGQVYDVAQHKIHECGCCANLFVDPSDQPRLCGVCMGALVHPLGGPLAEPIGAVA